MKKQKLVQIIKAVVNTNSVIPIIECVSLRNDTLVVTDLELTVTIPYHSGINAAISSKQFISAYDLMDAPVFSKKDFAVTITEGKRTIKVSSDNNEEFPLTLPDDHKPFEPIGKLTVSDLESIVTAMKFTSNDDLRPSMTGIFIHDEIAATDAHRLFWRNVSEQFAKPIILPFKCARLITMLGGEWTCEANDIHAILKSEGVEITVRLIDAIYPKYKVVIPTGKGCALLSVDCKEMATEIRNCLKFANRQTNMVALSLNGETKLHSQDVDFDYEYDIVLDTAQSVKREDIEIGFNGRLMLDVLSQQEQKKPVKITLYGTNKAILVNEGFLIMPLMLNGSD